MTRPVIFYTRVSTKLDDGTVVYAKEKVEGKFHQFNVHYEEFSEGPGNYAVAIVEMPDGTVKLVEADEIQFTDVDTRGSPDIKHSDLLIEVFTSGAVKVDLRITHKPTGISVRGYSRGAGRYRLKNRLLEELENKLTKGQENEHLS